MKILMISLGLWGLCWPVGLFAKRTWDCRLFSMLSQLSLGGRQGSFDLITTSMENYDAEIFKDWYEAMHFYDAKTLIKERLRKGSDYIVSPYDRMGERPLDGYKAARKYLSKNSWQDLHANHATDVNYHILSKNSVQNPQNIKMTDQVENLRNSEDSPEDEIGHFSYFRQTFFDHDLESIPVLAKTPYVLKNGEKIFSYPSAEALVLDNPYLSLKQYQTIEGTKRFVYVPNLDEGNWERHKEKLSLLFRVELSINLPRTNWHRGLLPRYRTELVEYELRKMKKALVNARYKEEKIKAIGEFHHALISIHPFDNGNGRSTRVITEYLLESVGLARPVWTHFGVDLFIRKEDFIKILADSVDQGEELNANLSGGVIQIRKSWDGIRDLITDQDGVLDKDIYYNSFSEQFRPFERAYTDTFLVPAQSQRELDTKLSFYGPDNVYRGDYLEINESALGDQEVLSRFLTPSDWTVGNGFSSEEVTKKSREIAGKFDALLTQKPDELATVVMNHLKGQKDTEYQTSGFASFSLSKKSAAFHATNASQELSSVVLMKGRRPIKGVSNSFLHPLQYFKKEKEISVYGSFDPDAMEEISIFDKVNGKKRKRTFKRKSFDQFEVVEVNLSDKPHQFTVKRINYRMSKERFLIESSTHEENVEDFVLFAQFKSDEWDKESLEEEIYVPNGGYGWKALKDENKKELYETVYIYPPEEIQRREELIMKYLKKTGEDDSYSLDALEEILVPLDIKSRTALVESLFTKAKDFSQDSRGLSRFFEKDSDYSVENFLKANPSILMPDVIGMDFLKDDKISFKSRMNYYNQFSPNIQELILQDFSRFQSFISQ